MADVTLTIDGECRRPCLTETTILKAAEKAGRHIPTICYHDHCTANGLVPHLRGRSRRRKAACPGVPEPGERRHEGLHLERARRAQPPDHPGDARLGCGSF